MAGFADELGRISAAATHQKHLTHASEKASLAAKMWDEWRGIAGIREKAKAAAGKGDKSYCFTFDARQYGFKEFKPVKEDIIANLPEPLKLEWGFKKLRVSHGSGYPHYLMFDCALVFEDEADKHLAEIKRKADADAKGAADPAPKRAKDEVKSEVPPMPAGAKVVKTELR